MILVTGGAGFIGSNLIAELDKRGLNVIVSDWLGSDSKWKNLANRNNVTHIIFPHDLPYLLAQQNNGITAVFHLGAISSTTENDTDKIIKNNFHLSCELKNWCYSNRIPFIYASSASTYGDGSRGFNDDVDDLPNLTQLNPYGWSKHLFDKGIPWNKMNYGTQCVGLKFFNVYGPNEYHKGEQRSVINKMYTTISNNLPCKLFKSYKHGYEDGEQSRDFIWVGDIVKIMMWMYDNPSVSGLFNVGTGKARSFNDMANIMYKMFSKESKIEYIDMPVDIREHYQYFTEANIDKLLSAGYNEPVTSLEDGIRMYVNNYLCEANKYI